MIAKRLNACRVFSAQNPNEVTWSKYWTPKLYIENSTGNVKENVWYTVMFNASMEAFVFERRRVAGTFIENLELYQFPFDTQVLSIDALAASVP